MRRSSNNETKFCPCCNKPMRPEWGLRGVNPNYYRELGWRCTSGYDCDMVGNLLYADTLADPARIETLANISRNNHFVLMARARMGG